MPKRVHVEPHLSSEELEKRYRQACDGVERSHYQIVWLLSQGKLTLEVVEDTGYSAARIRQMARLYNQGKAYTPALYQSYPARCTLITPSVSGK